MNIKPDFSITANSKDVTKALTERVASVEIIQHSGFISDNCILTLDDHRQSRMQTPKPGDKIRIALGYQGTTKLVDHGEYEVAEYSFSGARDTLTIFANKLLWSDSLKSPVHHSWPSTEEEPLLLKSLVGDIAGKHGLEPRIDSTLGNIKLPGISQTESDLQLLTKLATHCDATVRVVERYLTFMPRGTGRSRSGAKLDEVPLERKQLIKWHMLASEFPAYKSCKAYYHDTINAKRLVAKAGSGKPCFELAYALADKETAQWAAQSRLNDFQRTGNTLTATAIGEPNLMAGGIATLSGVRAGIDGPWFLTKVHHLIDSCGFVSTIEGEKLTP